MSGYLLRPWTVKAALPFVAIVHRRLPRIQGGMWAVRVLDADRVVGAGIVGHAARMLAEKGVLALLRVAVIPGHPNACSMIYGACSRAAKAMNALGLVTYTHGDESGTSLKASNWLYDGMTDGGEHYRPSRLRKPAIDAGPKGRWWAPWSDRSLLTAPLEDKPLANGDPAMSFVQLPAEAEMCGAMLMVRMPAGYEKPMSRCGNPKPCADHPEDKP